MHVLLMKKLKYTEALLLLFSIQNWSFTSAMLTFNGKLYCAEGNSNFDWKASAKTSNFATVLQSKLEFHFSYVDI